jgi:phosphotransferase system enzyme I (PtsI)
VIEGPVIMARDYQTPRDKPLSFLIRGSIRELKLADEQAAITFRPQAETSQKATRLDNHTLKGVPASLGYGFGLALQLLQWGKGLEVRKYTISEGEVEAEINRFMAARDKTVTALEAEIELAAQEGSKDLQAILEFHKVQVMDPGMTDQVCARIRDSRFNAEHMLSEVISKYVRRLEATDHEYLKGRIADIRDVGNRILGHLLKVEGNTDLAELNDDVIVYAEEISPADMSGLHSVKDRIKGFITERGGPTSHTAIIARSLGIPALVGARGATRLLRNGDRVALFGGEGTALINPDQVTVSEFLKKQRVFGVLVQKIGKEVKGKPARTRDGVVVSLEGNVSTNNDVPMVRHFEGDGVGLFRSEYLYMNREKAPTEAELFHTFSNIIGKAKIRSFDFGGDKLLAGYMPYLPPEETSFLGLRGVRLYFHDSWWGGLFQTQLKAILRASKTNPGLQIMFPMISQVAELRRLNRIVDEVKGELAGEYNPDIKTGIMIEVPSAVGVSDELARETDFFSIGTNDLVQYTLGVARENELVAHLYDPFHRSVLWSIFRTVNSARQENIPVGVCGAMAASPLGAAMLVGMGVDALSMPPSDIPMIKYALRGLRQKELRDLVGKVLHDGSVTAEIVSDSGRQKVAELARETLSMESFERLAFLEGNLSGKPII